MLLVRHLVKGRSAALVLAADLSVLDAARFLRDQRIGGAPVMQGKELIGFCSERDLVFRVVAEGRDPKALKVRDIMTADVVTATLDETVEECQARIRKAHCRHLPILDGDRLVTCLSSRDFQQANLLEAERELDQLKSYIQGST